MKLWHSTRDSCGRVRSRALSAAAAAALVFGLVSCGDSEQEEPTAAPVPTSSSSDGGGDGSGSSDEGGDSSAASPSASGDGDGGALSGASDGGGERVTLTRDDFPPPDPANYPGLNTHTEQGAVATVEYFWNSLFWAAWSGDFSTVEKHSGDNCEGCEILLRKNKEAYREQFYLTPSVLIPRSDTVELSTDIEGYEFVVFVTMDEYVTAKALEGEEDHLETVNGMNWSGDHWVIEELDSIPAEGTAE